MNRALITLAMVLASSVSMFAQGGIVFNNLGGNLVTIGPLSSGRNVMATDHILVQLLWLNPITYEFEPVSAPVSSWPLPTGGVFYGGTHYVSLANLYPPGWTWRVRAWEGSYGTVWPMGYETALNQGGAVQTPVTGPDAGVRGGIVEFQCPTSDPNVTLPPVGMAPYMPAFYLAVPEPTVIALGIMGLAALLPALLLTRSRHPIPRGAPRRWQE